MSGLRLIFYIFSWMAAASFALALYAMVLISTTVHEEDFLLEKDGPTLQRLARVGAEQRMSFDDYNDCQRFYCYQQRVYFHQIPSSLWKGLMGIEDLRFLEHQGVDLIGILRALWVDLRQWKLVQGGSTLTQQLVRNLYLSSEKSLWRKFNEIILSFYIDYRFEKEEILQGYFNEIEWASLGGVAIKGVYAASQMYFNKKPDFLDDYESSILVAMLKGPYLFHPLRHPDRLRQRADLVFETLLNKNMISQLEKKQLWGDEKWSEWQEQLKKREQSQDLKIITEILRPRYGSAELEKIYPLVRAGHDVLNDFKKREHLQQADLAFKIYHYQEAEKAFFYYSKIERDFEQALSAEFHQVGSILKPIWVRALRDLGLAWNVEVATRPVTLDLKSGQWTPRESYQHPAEMLTLLETLQLSRNIPLIRLIDQIGFDVFEEKIRDWIPQLKLPLAQYPAQILGAIELSFEQLAQVYQTFIEQECTDVNLADQLMSETVLYALSDPKLTTLQKAVDERMADFRFFGKTGTSNNGYDNWFVAYSEDSLTLIWLGHEGVRLPDQSLQLSGAWSAYKIFEKAVLDYQMPLLPIECAK